MVSGDHGIELHKYLVAPAFSTMSAGCLLLHGCLDTVGALSRL